MPSPQWLRSSGVCEWWVPELRDGCGDPLGREGPRLPPSPASRPQVHGQVLYTASHDGALRLWDVRGLPRAPPLRPAAPQRSLSRLFSNKVGCATTPLQPA